jgi:hypothetical protein
MRFAVPSPPPPAELFDLAENAFAIILNHDVYVLLWLGMAAASNNCGSMHYNVIQVQPPGTGKSYAMKAARASMPRDTVTDKNRGTRQEMSHEKPVVRGVEYGDDVAADAMGDAKTDPERLAINKVGRKLDGPISVSPYLSLCAGRRRGRRK